MAKIKRIFSRIWRAISDFDTVWSLWEKVPSWAKVMITSVIPTGTAYIANQVAIFKEWIGPNINGIIYVSFPVFLVVFFGLLILNQILRKHYKYRSVYHIRDIDGKLTIVFDTTDASCITNKTRFNRRKISKNSPYYPDRIHKEYRIRIENNSSAPIEKVIAELITVNPYEHAFNNIALRFLEDTTIDGSISREGITIPAGKRRYVKVVDICDYDNDNKEQFLIHFAIPGIPNVVDASRERQFTIGVSNKNGDHKQKTFSGRRNPDTDAPEFFEVANPSPDL